eukprot:maker-scaffold_9-snap-gene-7.24-mRNA-1 protein AED:0.00 eAED:0.00 QI:43/0.66/0.75/1/1/1/4/996/303
MEKSSLVSYHALLATTQLEEKITRQLEYYFSDENLPGDEYLFSRLMKKDARAWVCLKTINTFKKMKDLHIATSFIASSLKFHSLELEVSRDNTKVRRRNSLARDLFNDHNRLKKLTLCLYDMDSTISRTDITNLVHNAGIPKKEIGAVRIRNGRAIIELKSNKLRDILFSYLRKSGFRISTPEPRESNLRLDVNKDVANKENKLSWAGLMKNNSSKQLTEEKELSPSFADKVKNGSFAQKRRYTKEFILSLRNKQESQANEEFKSQLSFTTELIFVDVPIQVKKRSHKKGTGNGSKRSPENSS